MKLHPIGTGSTAEEVGYDFELLLGWLENVRHHELERCETKPRYQVRAHALSDLVDGLSQLNDGRKFKVELQDLKRKKRPRKTNM